MLSTITTYVWILYAVAMVQTFSHALYFMSAIFAALLTYSYFRFYTRHALKKQIAQGKVAPESAYFKVKSAKLAAGCAYAVIGIYLLGLISSAVKNGVSPSDLSSKDSQIVLIISMLLLIGVVAAEIYRTVNRRNTPQEAQPEPEQPPTPQEAAGQRCPRCGEPALPENTFCGSCGTALRPEIRPPEEKTIQKPKRIYRRGKELFDPIDTYVVVKIETSGLDPDLDDIIEFAAIKVIDGKAEETFKSLVCPFLEISEEIEELTGIKNRMLETAPDKHSVLAEFLDFVGESVVVGHNVEFDLKFIREACISAFDEGFANNYISTKTLAENLLENELDYYSMESVAEYFGYEYPARRRAMSDARLVDRCYRKLKQLHKKKTKENTQNCKPQ